MSDPRFKTIKYGERGRDWDMQIALTGEVEDMTERAILEEIMRLAALLPAGSATRRTIEVPAGRVLARMGSGEPNDG